MLYHSLSCWCAQSINILYTPAWIRASSPGCDGHQTITHTQATRDTHTLSVKNIQNCANTADSKIRTSALQSRSTVGFIQGDLMIKLFK